MGKRKVTLTLDADVWNIIGMLADKDNRSRSNMIEKMTMFFYENDQDIKEILAKEKIDQI